MKITRKEIIEELADRYSEDLDNKCIRAILKGGWTGFDDRSNQELIQDYVFYFEPEVLTFVSKDNREFFICLNLDGQSVNWIRTGSLN